MAYEKEEAERLQKELDEAQKAPLVQAPAKPQEAPAQQPAQQNVGDWKAHTAKSGRTYWHNAKTGESTWTNPGV